MKIIIKNGIVISMDNTKPPFAKEDIVIENDKIIYIGNHYQDKCDKEIDAKNKIVMPGLINCHTHLGMSIFRATNDNYPLNQWLKEYIWPIEDRLSDEDMYYTTLLSIIEMIKTGTTCFNDMYYNWKGSFKAFQQIGIRGIYGRCLIGNDNEFKKRVKDFKELYQTNHSELITLSIAPHSLYTIGEKEIIETEKLATEYKLPIHIHLSENEEEVNNITNKYSILPVDVLNKYKLLDHKLLIAHGTFISNKELTLLKNKKVSICTNPVSNLNLGCGIADINKYQKKGINICIGTDGVGSGNNMNLFYHMSLLDNLQKGKYKDPTVMSSYEVLKIATINGAYALGMEKEIGSIEVGKKADMIILSLEDIELFPYPNLINQIVHNAWYHTVDTTIINGKILMENKKLNIDVDLEELKNKIIKIRNKLLKEWKQEEEKKNEI